MSTAQNLAANTQIHDQTLHDEGNSLFKPDRWGVVPRHAMDLVDVLPCNNAQYGAWVDFDMPEAGEMLGQITLALNTGHGTSSVPDPGNTDSWVNGLGYQIWEEARIMAGSKVIQEIYSDSLRYRDSLARDIRDEDSDAVTYYQGQGDAASRNATWILADNSQELRIRLPFYFTDSLKKYLFTPALSRELRVRVRFRSVEACVNAVGAATVVSATMSNVRLISQYWHLSSQHRDEIMDGVYARGQQAVPFLMRDEQHHHDEVILAGATTHQLRLSNIRQPVTMLYFALRTEADSSKVTSTTEKSPEAVQDVVASYTVRDGNVIIVPETERLYDQHILRRQFWPGQPGNGVYAYPLSLDPMDKSNATNHVNFHSYSNPVLTLTFTAALASNMRLYVIGDTNNFATIVNGHGLKSFH